MKTLKFFLSKSSLRYVVSIAILALTFLIDGCDLFLPKREIIIYPPGNPYSEKSAPSPVKFEVVVISSSGDSFHFSTGIDDLIYLELEEGAPLIILAYPIYENSKFEVKPSGIFYMSGVSEEKDLHFDVECGAALVILGELFNYGFSLPGFNCYRFSRLFYSRTGISPFAFDIIRIKQDIIKEEFSTLSLERKRDYPIEISKIPEGSYFPADPFLENVEVDSDGIFATTLYVGLHQYLNSFDNSILELSCDENGSVVFFIIEK